MDFEDGSDTLGHVTIVYPAYPNKTQEKELKRQFGIILDFYNDQLDRRLDDFRAGKDIPTFFDMCKELTVMRKDDPRLRTVGIISLRDALQRLRRSMEACRERSKRNGRKSEPRRKTDPRYRSLAFEPRTLKIAGNRIKLSRELNLRCRNLHIPKGGRPVVVRVVHKGSGRWYIHVTYEIHRKIGGRLCLDGVEAEGYDLGLLDEVTDTAGNKTKAPDFYKMVEAELSKLRRRLSKLDPKGAEHERISRRIARLEERAARQRDGYLDQVADQILGENDVVVMEDIDVRRILGKTGNTVLRRKLYTEAAWGILYSKVERKAAKSGVHLIRVNPAYTTRTCSCCGRVGEEMPLATRLYRCPECGLRMDRDRNAALNILGSGMGTLRYAEPSW